MPVTFGLDFQLALRCARSIAAHTLSIAVPLLAARPDLIVSGLPNTTVHCQSPPSSRTTVYSMPRYSINRPISNANLPLPTPLQWSILLALRKLNAQRPTAPDAHKAQFEARTSGMNSARHQITVVFACRKCGAIYQASQRRCTDRHFGVYNCLACRTQVYAWHGTYDFVDWKVGFLVGRAAAKSGAAAGRSKA